MVCVKPRHGNAKFLDSESIFTQLNNKYMKGACQEQMLETEPGADSDWVFDGTLRSLNVISQARGSSL